MEGLSCIQRYCADGSAERSGFLRLATVVLREGRLRRRSTAKTMSPVPTGPGFRALAARGIFFTGAAQAYRIALGFAANVLLIRLLAPSDFGLIAMVSTCLALITLIQDLGLNQATIQREHVSQRQMSALFWLAAGFSAALAIVFAVSAPAIAWFFRDARVEGLVLAFAGLIVLTGLQSQQIAFMTRHLRFKALAVVEVMMATANALVGVTLAWVTGSYWALFAASAASTLSGLVASWIISGWRPVRPSFDGQFREIFLFGSGVSGFNIVNYFARNADNLLIGRVYGSEELGYYDRAYKLLLFPIQQIQGPLGRVMLPLLSRLQNEPERYRKAYVECITLMMLASHPGLVFLIVFAEDVFLMLFGPHWLPAAPIFQWLGVCGLQQVMTSTVGWLYLSQGRGGGYFKIGLFNALVSVASFGIGIYWGALGVAAAYTIGSFTILMPATWWATGREGPVSARNLISAALPHFIATVVCAAVLIASTNTLTPSGAFEWSMLAAGTYALYAVVVAVFPEKRAILLTNGRVAGKALMALRRECVT